MARSCSKLSERVASARPPGWEICEAARAMAAGGVPVIMLGTGLPDADSPPAAVAAAIGSLGEGRTRYAHPQGEPALRELLARRHGRACDAPTEPSDVLVAPGAQAAVLSCLQAVLDPGDGVGVLDPSYPLYANALAAVSARPVPIALDPRRGFALDPGAIAAAGPMRALLLTNPHNPTGRVLTPGELGAIARACRERDLWLVADEVYAGLAPEGAHRPAASFPGMAERTFTVGSLSKGHAMSGWRCGWAVAPRGLGATLASLASAGSLGIPPFVQDAACAALSEGAPTVAALRESYGIRARALVGALAPVRALRPVVPESGMFVMVDVTRTGLDGTAFAWDLLDRGVCVIPGRAFGESCAGFVRVSLSAPPDRLAAAAAAMAEVAAGGVRTVGRPGRVPPGRVQAAVGT